MSAETDNNRFAPPKAHVEDVATGSQELAGRGARLGAALIDTAIQLGVFYGLAYTVFTSLRPENVATRGLVGTIAINFGLGILLFAAIHGYLLATQGQTVGKKLVGLRIVGIDGERLPFGKLIGMRYAVGWLITMVPVVGMVYALVDSLFIFREPRRCLHDLIAGTIVVKV